MQENWQRFADKYFETLNGTQSAIYAGFSEDTAKQQAWQLLQREEIQEYLQKLRAEYAEKTGITKEWVIERFKSISDRCVQAEPVMIRVGREMVHLTDEDGNGVYQFDSAGANTATAHLGKIIGVFEKDNEQRTPNISILNLDPLSNVDNDNGAQENISTQEED